MTFNLKKNVSKTPNHEEEKSFVPVYLHREIYLTQSAGISSAALRSKWQLNPKMSVLLDFLAEIDIIYQDKMIACSFEIIS